jgi:hypothetical protein
MLEFVLALPFLWIVIALSFGGGSGWLARHQVRILTRERALTGPAHVNTSDEQRGLRATDVTGGFADSSSEPSLAGSSLTRRLLSGVSGTERVCFDGRKSPPARLFRTVPISECFEVDSGTWTYADTEGRLGDALASALGSGFGRFADLLR